MSSLSLQTGELNFTSTTLGFQDPSNQQSGFRPPDTMGGVGSDRIVELINGRYTVYDKNTGAELETSTLDDFWSNSGVEIDGFTFDPRVLYDPFSERWFAVSVDDARGVDNSILLAVSETSDPTDGWKGYDIDGDLEDKRWADFPTLGFDAEGVYISASMFDIPNDGESNDTTTTIVAVPKDNLLALTPTLGETTFRNNSLSDTGFTVQPVVDLDNTEPGQPAALLSAFNTSSGIFKRTNITGDLTSPNLDIPGTLISVTAYNSPSDAEQPQNQADIESGDSRFSGNVVLQNGDLWGVQTVENNGRNALRWFRIDEDSNLLIDEGLIADESLDFYYGSIAVNEFNDVVIGFSGSGENQFVSTYAALGETVGNNTTFDDPLLLQEGVDTYVSFDGIGRNRWGDYSATVIDPDDPFTFWTFQEFVSAEDVWSTQITELNLVSSVPTLGNDNIQGSPNNDIISALAGNDTVNGNQGNDNIQGNQGNDTLRGNQGDDSINGNLGNDVVLGGSGDDLLKGGNGNDTLEGETETDTLEGGRGADILVGGDGDDLLKGERGADTLQGGDGADTLEGGRGKDSLVGGNGADILQGGRGADFLSGGNDQDLLVGGKGLDILTGGNGDDTFAAQKGKGIDTITDFAPGEDVLQLRGFDNDTLRAEFSSVSSPGDVAGEDALIIYDSSSGLVYYNPDGSTSGDEQAIAQLDSGLNLDENDFEII